MERQARLLIILAMLGFACMGALSRQANLGFLTISFYRSVLVALSFLALYLLQEGTLSQLLPSRKDFTRLVVPYGLSVALASATFVGAFIFTSISNAVFLHNLAPVFVFALAGWFFGEKARSQEVAGGLLGILGVACISGVSFLSFLTFVDARQLQGDFLALVSAVGYALVLIYTRRVRQEGLGLYATLFWMWVVASCVLFVPNLLWGSFGLTGASLTWLVLLALVSTTGPFVLLNMGMRHLRASQVSLLAMTEALFAWGIDVVFYRQSMPLLALLGGALVLAGIGVAQESETPDEASPQPDEPAVEDVPCAPPVSETPLLVALAVYMVVLNAQALTALLTGSPVAVAAVALVLTTGLALLLAFLEGRYARLRLPGGLVLPAAASLLGALLTLVAVALAGMRAWAATSPPSGALAVALVGLVLAAATVTWMKRYLSTGAQPRAALRAGAAAVGLAVATLGQVLAMAGLGLDKVFVVAIVAMAVALGLEAFGTGLGELVPRWGRRLSMLAERRLIDPRIARWGLAALLVLYAFSGFFVVHPHEKAVVQWLGQSGDPLGPGLHYAAPYPFARVNMVDAEEVRVAYLGLRQGHEEGGLQQGLVLTGDVNIAELELAVEYRITDPASWLFRVADPDALIRASADSVIRDLVAHVHNDALLVSLRPELQDRARASLQGRLEASGTGVKVLAFRILSARPPRAVLDSFLDVVSAAEDKNTSINQARAYGATEVPQARGEAEKMLREAEARAREQLDRSRGDTLRFVAMQAAFARSRAVSAFRMYVETVEEALQDVEKYITDPGLVIEFRYKKTRGETK